MFRGIMFRAVLALVVLCGSGAIAAAPASAASVQPAPIVQQMATAPAHNIGVYHWHYYCIGGDQYRSLYYPSGGYTGISQYVGTCY